MISCFSINMLGICVLRNCFGVIFSKLTLDYVNFYQNLEFQNKLFSSIQYLLTCIDRKQRILTKYLKIFFFTLKPSLPSPQVKWSYLIINRNCMWELSHEFPNNLRLIEILGNKKKNLKSQKSTQASFQKFYNSISNSTRKLKKIRYEIFHKIPTLLKFLNWSQYICKGF